MRHQVSVKKLNESEALMKCRKGYLLTKLLVFSAPIGRLWQTTARYGSGLLATGQPALRRQDFYTGFYTKRGRLLVDAPEGFAKLPIILIGKYLQLNPAQGRRSN